MNGYLLWAYSSPLNSLFGVFHSNILAVGLLNTWTWATNGRKWKNESNNPINDDCFICEANLKFPEEFLCRQGGLFTCRIRICTYPIRNRFLDWNRVAWNTEWSIPSVQGNLWKSCKTTRARSYNMSAPRKGYLCVQPYISLKTYNGSKYFCDCSWISM